jgi:hypothetical protein
MESKVVSLDVIPGHPNFLRLPSLSRSLIHSIPPKACQEMHHRPKIFSISKKPSGLTGPPVLTPRKTRRKKWKTESFLQQAENARPCSSSYVYRKVFETKPLPSPVVKQYYSPKHVRGEKRTVDKTFYCEIEMPKGKDRIWKRAPVSLNTTQILFMQNKEDRHLQYIPEVQSNMESSEFMESMSNYREF